MNKHVHIPTAFGHTCVATVQIWSVTQTKSTMCIPDTNYNDKDEGNNLSFIIHSSSTIMEDEFQESNVGLTKTITTKQTISPKMYGLESQAKVKGACSTVLRTGVQIPAQTQRKSCIPQGPVILGLQKDLTSSSYTCRGIHPNTRAYMHMDTSRVNKFLSISDIIYFLPINLVCSCWYFLLISFLSILWFMGNLN